MGDKLTVDQIRAAYFAAGVQAGREYVRTEGVKAADKEVQRQRRINNKDPLNAESTVGFAQAVSCYGQAMKDMEDTEKKQVRFRQITGLEYHGLNFAFFWLKQARIQQAQFRLCDVMLGRDRQTR